MRSIWPVLLAMVLLASPAAGLAASFSSEAVIATGIQSTQANFRALEILDNSGGSTPRLHFENITGIVEVDKWGRTGTGDTPLDRATSSSESARGTLDLTLATPRPGFFAGIWTTSDAPNFDLTGNVLLEPRQVTRWSPPSYIQQDREVPEIPVGGAVAMQPNADAIHTIQGPFWITFWNWDVTYVTSDGTSETIWSGDEGGGPDTSDPPYLYANGAQQAYIFVEAGTLTITGDVPFESFYVVPETLEVNGSLELIDALPISGTTQSGNITILGQSVVEFLSIGEETMRFHVTDEFTDTAGELPGAEPSIGQGPNDVEPNTVVNTNNDAPEWLVSGSIIAILILAIAVGLLTNRLRVERAIQDARDATTYGVYDLAEARAKTALRGRDHTEAFILFVTAILRGDSAKRARQAMTQAKPRRLPPGLIEFLHATIEAHDGNQTEAARKLGEAILVDPAYTHQAAESELLAPILYLCQQATSTDNEAYS